jgi:glycosyltransferase involved in cell wall biosynthesis
MKLAIIGIPCGDMVHTDFAHCLWGLGRASQSVRQGVCVAKNSIVANARNHLVKACLEVNADYLLMIDSDMVFPPNTLDRLVAHNKDVVGGTYVRRGPPFDNLGQSIPEHEERSTGLVKMFKMPTGCLLIKTSVFARLKRPYFNYTDNEEMGCVNGEDMVFSDKLRAAGYSIWCDLDLSVELRHMYNYMLSPIDPSTRAVAEGFKKAQELVNAEAAGHG